MLLRAVALVAFLAVVPTLLSGQEEDSSRRTDHVGILGQVVDAETREPLEGVAVTLRLKGDSAGVLGRPRVVLTNAQGRFTYSDLVDGRYGIELERLGYGTITDSIAYRAALGLRVGAEMVPEAVELEPLLVAVEARSRHLQDNGFYRRQARGMGRFITREEIEERNPVEVTSMLAMVPGVRLRYGRGLGGETLVLMRGGCLAQVYLDGVRTLPPFGLDTHLNPDDVMAMEVYHASELPAQYGITGCGAVLVWTRLPEADELGNPFTLGRTLTALGFIGLVLLLVR